MVKLTKKTREQYTKLILDELNAGEKEMFRNTFLDLHPSDQLDIFVTLDSDARRRCYSYLTPKEFAEIFGGLDISDQKLFFLELDENYSIRMFNQMFTDDVVNFLTEINSERAEDILLQMHEEKAEKIKSLLSYAPETAGAIMTKELISISSTDTTADVLDMLRKEAPSAESIYYLYVVDGDGILVGVVSLRDLIIASPNEIVKDMMTTRTVSVPEDMDQEDVGRLIKKYDFLAVPVVSKDNHLLGIVTFDDVMDILEEEVTEDFGEISATKGATDLTLSPFTAAKKRAPWIIVLMFFGLVTGGVIGQFEETLEAVVVLAAFIPMIMGSAGNIGTQSLAVAVRGLALETIEDGGFWKMIRREFSTGFMIGIICMVLISIMITILYGNWMLALIVGVSILCTFGISAVIGSTIPLLINKLKLDPAIASGPFITTVNDIVGLLIYFSIATSMMAYL
ncbi:magnesium transporter [Oceanobacillus alkalisoli]|uniref:magnesium transporter n=1 Tax=Oceanobacillus alkalisoli TaxID=2925113 RepID=UPI001EE40A61|nr:magnesium transporter [Oceanobacillus alkalisoli]MCG5102743.1 magnesium transporter [Oceanobacillus alkalisoli]